jgi:hypothetical protein
MSGAEKKANMVISRLGVAQQKAIEGRTRELLRDMVRTMFKTPEEVESKLDLIESRAERYVALRDIILGTPWNKLNNMLSNLLQKDTHKQDTK